MAHVVFIHGVSNKPEQAELLKIWRRILRRNEGGDPGLNLTGKGVKSSLVYWADVLYGTPDEDIAAHESDNEAAAMTADPSIEEDWRGGKDEIGADWIDKMVERYGFDQPPPGGDDNYAPPAEDADGTYERIPLPWFIKRRVMKALVRDVHHYLFNIEHSPRPGCSYQVQDEIRGRFLKVLQDAAADDPPLVVVSHSMGTVIAYDCLKRVPGCLAVDALVTIGSPLGIDEVQDKLHPEWTESDGFPSAKVASDWVNIYDSIDVVSRLDPKIANDYKKANVAVVEDINQDNKGLWTHSMSKYLAGSKVRNTFRRLLGIPQGT